MPTWGRIGCVAPRRRMKRAEARRECYTPGYTADASRFMAKRRAGTHAAFFLPHLRPGMDLLDCGCGPGTITIDLAEAVAPGRVVGLDIEESQLALARTRAAERGVRNTEFKAGSIYELPFADGTFGAVFAHALFEHLSNPVRALREIRRVLKAGGVAGVCSPDWGGFLMAPSTPVLERAVAFYKEIQERNGGDPYVGRRLGALALEAGFSRIKLTASYECYEDLRAIAELLARRIEVSPTIEGTATLERADASQIAEMARALRTWSAHPDAFFAQTWVAAVGTG